MIFVSYWVENIVEKGENAGYQHFLLFEQCFQESSPLGSGFPGKKLIPLIAFNLCTNQNFSLS